jgi:hypothetical protein
VLIESLKSLAEENQAALRWVNLCARSQGFSVDLPAADSDFMVLFPEEGVYEDWRSTEERQMRAAQELALRWKDYNFTDLVERLVLWQQQVEALGGVGPQMLPVFARELAKLRTLSASELSVRWLSFPQEPRAHFWITRSHRVQLRANIADTHLLREIRALAQNLVFEIWRELSQTLATLN